MDILDYVLRGSYVALMIGGYLHKLIIVLGVLTKLFLNRDVSSLSGIARYALHIAFSMFCDRLVDVQVHCTISVVNVPKIVFVTVTS